MVNIKSTRKTFLEGPIVQSALFHLLPFILLTVHVFFKPSTADEGEHLHAAFQVGSGLKPYLDFFEHHMPAVWYLFSPIVLFSGFIPKIVFFKLMQSAVLAVVMRIFWYFFPTHRRWTSWAFALFMLFLAPFVDFADLRPEFVSLPFVFLSTSFILKNGRMSLGIAILLGALCGMHLFFSPRLYAFIMVLGLYVLAMPCSISEKTAFILSGLLTAALIALYLDISNLLFFVFTITRSVIPIPFEKLYYNPLLLRFTIVFYALSMLLQVILRKRPYLFLLALNVLMGLVWMQEKLPFQGQSTGFMLFMNFIFLFHLVQEATPLRTPKLLVFGMLAFFGAAYGYRRNIYRRYNFFKTAPVYVRKLRDCEGMTYQSHSLGSMIWPRSEARIHPLFIKDYTYFGYFQDHLLLGNLDRIVEHNKGRGVRYFSDIKPCHFDTTVARILKEQFPQAPYRYPLGDQP